MIRIILSVLLLSSVAQAREEKLTSFASDYCTFYPEGTYYRPGLWQHCCLQHDLYFWAGGEKNDRLNANYQLRDCVEKVTNAKHAKAVYAGVTAAQYSPIKDPDQKFNNAWRSRPDYQRLSTEDIDRIENHLRITEYPFLPDWMKIDLIDQLRKRQAP